MAVSEVIRFVGSIVSIFCNCTKQGKPWSPANATAAVHVWNPSKTKSKSIARGRQTTCGYSVLLVLSRQHDVSRSANAVSAGYRKFSLPSLIYCPCSGRPPSNLWKSFTDPKTIVFQAADGEDLVKLACNVFAWYTRVTNGQTDEQNCDG